MLRRLLLISTISVTLTACAGVTPLAEAPRLDSPDAFAAAAQLDAGQPVGDWVAALGDSGLEALVDEAMRRNPDVMVAIATLEAAEAGARSANAGRLPTAGASAGASETNRESGSTTGFSLGADISWQADVWGRLSDAARAGAFSREAAEADLYGARLSVAGAVARGWFAVIEARHQTELAERDVTAREDQLEIVERRFQRGVSRSSDVRTARSALATSRAALAGRVRTEAAARRSLEILAGRYPAAQLEAGADLPDLGPAPALLAPGPLLERRPDVAAAELRLTAAGFSAEAARKALYPSLSLSADISSSAGDLGDLLDGDALVETVSASLLAPLFQGGRLRAERDRAAAEARAQAGRYIRTVLAAWRETEDAIFAEQEVEERVAQLAVAREEAAAALQLVERQYASGVATIFELIDAQTRLISAEGSLITARTDRADSRVALHLALAGDFNAGGGLTAHPAQ
ncbi:MAG: efflux transporter outer membrane subunit [Pseudomonadota bacterium]